MPDIVERLREWLSENPACMEAADEIEMLRMALTELLWCADNFQETDCDRFEVAKKAATEALSGQSGQKEK